MKSACFYIITALSITFFQTGRLAAQDSIKSLPPVIVKATTTKVSGKIWKGFSKYFNEAEMPMSWYRVNKNYLVKFMIYDEQNRALFSKKGKLIYHISYGYEKNLPPEISAMVKEAYSDYNVTRAIKVDEAGRTIWVVNIETASIIKLLRIEDDEMEEVQNMQKSP
jgi:hypothetical protein